VQRELQTSGSVGRNSLELLKENHKAAEVLGSAIDKGTAEQVREKGKEDPRFPKGHQTKKAIKKDLAESLAEIASREAF